MAERGYPLARAAAELAACGLLASARVRLGEVWRECAPESLPDGFFAGAALDSRILRPGQLFVGVRGERVDGRNYVDCALRVGAAAALVESWSGTGDDPLAAVAAPEGCVLLLSPDPGEALRRLAATWRAGRVLTLCAITGSNGKTTTKDLLAAILGASAATHATAGNYNNQLGLPLTLLGLEDRHRFAVVEVGASRPGDIAELAPLAAPDVAVITNAAPAHLEGFGGLDAIVATKGDLLDALPADGPAVLNADSPGFARWRARARGPVISFGTGAGDHRWRWRPADDPGAGVLELDGREYDVPLPGRHNGENLTAALLAARACGGGDDATAAGLAAFAPSPHRGRLLRLGGLMLLDDSYNANPTSMVQAARALVELPGAGRRLAVLGAMAELGPGDAELHRETGRRLREAGLDLVATAGEAAAPLAEGFAAAGGAAAPCADRAEALAWLLANARDGDRVLVKGSRSAAMEEIVSGAAAAFGPGDVKERG